MAWPMRYRGVREIAVASCHQPLEVCRAERSKLSTVPYVKRVTRPHSSHDRCGATILKQCVNLEFFPDRFAGTPAPPTALSPSNSGDFYGNDPDRCCSHPAARWRRLVRPRPLVRQAPAISTHACSLRRRSGLWLASATFPFHTADICSAGAPAPDLRHIPLARTLGLMTAPKRCGGTFSPASGYSRTTEIIEEHASKAEFQP